jgi:hypothetical protein
MRKLVQLTPSILAILVFAGLAAAHGLYEPIKTTEFVAHPESYDGRLVEVRANIIAISADRKSLELFDSQSRMTITVRLTNLPKSQRSALIHSPARGLLVYGLATVIGRRMVIDAHKVEALPIDAGGR